jgi:hypothetical protein
LRLDGAAQLRNPYDDTNLRPAPCHEAYEAGGEDEGVVTWAVVREIFDRMHHAADWWDTVGEAERLLSPDYEFFYGALLSAEATGLPGNGFYRKHSEERPYEYKQILGDADPAELTERQKLKLVNYERARLYEHANS